MDSVNFEHLVSKKSKTKTLGLTGKWFGVSCFPQTTC